MTSSARIVLCSVAMAACLLLLADPSTAGTIIKLGLGGDAAADIEFDGNILSTVNDGDAGTTGDQNTDAQFQDFLFFFPDILTPTASFSLNNLLRSGPANVFMNVLVIQNFNGGTLELYDPANGLLLSGTLAASSLTGPIGPPATGALFTTSFSTVTGGSLKPFINVNSLTLSMSFTNVLSNPGGAGFTVGAAAPLLNPFTADTTLNMAGTAPEPSVATLVLIVGAIAASCRSNRRRN